MVRVAVVREFPSAVLPKVRLLEAKDCARRNINDFALQMFLEYDPRHNVIRCDDSLCGSSQGNWLDTSVTQTLQSVLILVWVPTNVTIMDAPDVCVIWVLPTSLVFILQATKNGTRVNICGETGWLQKPSGRFPRDDVCMRAKSNAGLAEMRHR